jgi:excinuclease ABC subunit A
LVEVLNQLVDAGNSVLVIEHNLDVIKTADWIIDLGPGGGPGGGEIIARGTPEDVARQRDSQTGRYLARLLKAQKKASRRKARPEAKANPRPKAAVKTKAKAAVKVKAKAPVKVKAKVRAKAAVKVKAKAAAKAKKKKKSGRTVRAKKASAKQRRR